MVIVKVADCFLDGDKTEVRRHVGYSLREEGQQQVLNEGAPRVGKSSRKLERS